MSQGALSMHDMIPIVGEISRTLDLALMLARVTHSSMLSPLLANSYPLDDLHIAYLGTAQHFATSYRRAKENISYDPIESSLEIFASPVGSGSGGTCYTSSWKLLSTAVVTVIGTWV